MNETERELMEKTAELCVEKMGSKLGIMIVEVQQIAKTNKDNIEINRKSVRRAHAKNYFGSGGIGLFLIGEFFAKRFGGGG